MTAQAGERLMRSGQGKLRLVVIVGGPRPGGGAVTGLAGGAETGLQMVWLGGGIVVALVARHAGRALAGVDAVRMAALASERLMGSGQREIRRIVIERSARPGRGRVALRAVGAVAGLSMVRIRRGVVVALVARHARRILAGIDPVPMTALAGNRLMRPRQREIRRVVIERCARTCRGRVALRAVGAVAGLSMVRIRRRVIVALVTRHARRVLAGIDPVPMTALAGDRLVRPRQRELRLVVIERRARPGGHIVTLLALHRVPTRRMSRVRGRLVLGQVAGDAVGRRQRQNGGSDRPVTIGTLRLEMGAGQGEAGDLVPALHFIPRKETAGIVAGGAGHTELAIVGILMTGGAGGARLLEVERRMA